MHTPNPLICEDDLRRRDVRLEGYNGFDYLEVDLEKGTLTVFLLAKLERPENLTPRHFVVHGGRRVRDVRITRVETCTPPDPRLDDCLVLTFNHPGDTSTYTLCIVALDADGRPTDEPYPGFDRRYACLDFTFTVDCPSDLDCLPPQVCLPEPYKEPEINYLAKDYTSFRQLILDRLALILPGWQERHAPDLGIALVELLAYTGDYLSYYQDAVATEAYLDTARRRISVRRHAHLVDYHMHEGANARAWLCLTVDAPVVELDPADVTFVTQVEGRPVVLSWEEDLPGLPPGSYEVFSPLLPGGDSPGGSYRVQQVNQRWISEPEESPAKIVLRQAHNCLRFYTWGDASCCLPRGATAAWLRDDGAVRKPPEQAPYDPKQQPPPYPTPPPPSGPPGPDDFDWSVHLQPGDFLIFEEVKGPKTGVAADADRAHRHVMRLTKVKRDVDPLYEQPILEIEWAAEDALPFPLCISAPAGDDCEPVDDVSVVCGNVILVDHGRPVRDEDLGCVPGECLPGECECDRPGDITHLPGCYRPRLQETWLAFRQALPPGQPAARRLLEQDPRQATPAVRLLGFPAPDCRPWEPVPEPEPPPGKDPTQQGPEPEPPAAAPLRAERWLPQHDLLDSDSASRHFVAEVDDERRTQLRFGDNHLGLQPAAHTRFLATYLVTPGGAEAGNVGAETITHLVYFRHRPAGIRSVRNPLPASGGLAPEPVAEVKLYAPYAFKQRLERAVLASDYAEIVMRDFPAQVQRAHAELRWNGSGYQVLVAVDALGGAEASPELLAAIEEHLAPYRRIGHDLAVRPAIPAGLVLELEVCAAPETLQGHVKAALLEVFSTRTLPDGTLGFFHPDRLSFGGGIFLSEIVAAAQKTPGVLSVTVTGLRRVGDPYDPTGAVPDDAVLSGVLPLGPLEVARLDNNASQPENGRLTITMRGGR